MAAVSGKGISAAVRGAIREWMTDKTVDILYEEYKKQNKDRGIIVQRISFSYLIRSADDWVRIVRYKDFRGFIRTYHSKSFNESFNDRSITLEVKTNSDDSMIEYVTVKVGGRIIGGGKVNVPSVLESQRGRSAKLDLDLAFIPFSERELAELQAEMEHGGAAIHALLFEREI